jgi:hypothetical protein
MPSNHMPWHYGFIGEFSHKARLVIKSDVMVVLHKLGVGAARLNKGVITLIPK